MSYHQQYRDRVRQALATDARAAGTTIDGLPLEKCYNVACEIATLYSQADFFAVADAVITARTSAREKGEAT